MENILASSCSFPPPRVHNYTPLLTTVGVIQISESPTCESRSTDVFSMCSSLESQQTSVVVDAPKKMKTIPPTKVDMNQTSDSHNTLPLTVNQRFMSTALVCQPVAHLK